MGTVKYYLHNPSSAKPTIIFLHYPISPSLKVIFSTRNKIIPDHWNKPKQRAKELKNREDYKTLNQLLDKLVVHVNKTHHEYLTSETPMSKSELVQSLKTYLNIDTPPLKISNTISLSIIDLLAQFISDCKDGVIRL